MLGFRSFASQPLLCGYSAGNLVLRSAAARRGIAMLYQMRAAPEWRGVRRVPSSLPRPASAQGSSCDFCTPAMGSPKAASRTIAAPRMGETSQPGQPKGLTIFVRNLAVPSQTLPPSQGLTVRFATCLGVPEQPHSSRQEPRFTWTGSAILPNRPSNIRSTAPIWK
jgi:hypothetical protein